MKLQFYEKLAAKGRSLDGRPIWRIVWAPEQLERRLGTFCDFYGPVFLRERREVREVPKYWYVGPCWVLERLTFIPPGSPILSEIRSSGSIVDPHTPVVNGSYEPVYVFQDGNRNPLPVTEVVIDAIFESLEGRARVKLTDGQMRDEYHQEIDRDARYFEAEIQDSGRSPLFAFDNSVYIERTKPDAI